MKELAYYSVFAIVLYFVLTQVFENFNIEQENFDPSLVPVSSIVTLAKVAQKLVNGNGTLTNPGNLQIGASASTPGNLTVTGNFLLGNKAMLYANGDKFANDNWVRLMKADGATAYSGMNGGGLAVSNLYSEQDTTANRNLQVNGNATVNGDLILGTHRWHKSTDGKNRLHFSNNAGTHYGSGDGHHYFRTGPDASGADGMVIDPSANVRVQGNINIAAGGGNNGINIVSGNPYISFTKTGAAGAPQLYSDGTTLHAYNAPFQADGNLTVQGDLILGLHRWHKSTDGKNRLHFSNNVGTHYASGDGNHYFRTGANAEGPDGVVIDSGHNVRVVGKVGFGGDGAQGFKWGHEGGNGWSCLRTNKSDNRLCFNQDHGITHFSPGGNLEIPGRMSAPNGIDGGNGNMFNHPSKFRIYNVHGNHYLLRATSPTTLDLAVVSGNLNEGGSIAPNVYWFWQGARLCNVQYGTYLTVVDDANNVTPQLRGFLDQPGTSYQIWHNGHNGRKICTSSLGTWNGNRPPQMNCTLYNDNGVIRKWNDYVNDGRSDFYPF